MPRRPHSSHRRPADAPRRPEPLAAPTSDYTDAEGGVLTLRGSLTAGSRAQYARVLAGEGTSGLREDAWHRAVELLFERLAVRWTIAGSVIDRQGELVARLRVATPQERAWIRQALRAHCAEHFPEVKAP